MGHLICLARTLSCEIRNALGGQVAARRPAVLAVPSPKVLEPTRYSEFTIISKKSGSSEFALLTDLVTLWQRHSTHKLRKYIFRCLSGMGDIARVYHTRPGTTVLESTSVLGALID